MGRSRCVNVFFIAVLRSNVRGYKTIRQNSVNNRVASLSALRVVGVALFVVGVHARVPVSKDF